MYTKNKKNRERKKSKMEKIENFRKERREKIIFETSLYKCETKKFHLGFIRIVKS